MFAGRRMRGMRAWLLPAGALEPRTAGTKVTVTPANPHPISARSWKVLLSPPQTGLPGLLCFMAFFAWLAAN